MFVVAMLAMLAAAAAAEPAPPIMSLLDKAQCGQRDRGIAEAGAFVLSVNVVGARSGPRYNCTAAMASVNATAATDCSAWLPSRPDEALSISLRATDERGAVAACMEWQLAAGNSTPNAQAWTPARSDGAGGIEERVREAVRSADTQLLDATAGPLPVPGSGGHVAGRKVAYDQ